jgi:hypothetical protein
MRMMLTMICLACLQACEAPVPEARTMASSVDDPVFYTPAFVLVGGEPERSATIAYGPRPDGQYATVTTTDVRGSSLGAGEGASIADLLDLTAEDLRQMRAYLGFHPCDTNLDGAVNLADLNAVLAAFGE